MNSLPKEPSPKPNTQTYENQFSRSSEISTKPVTVDVWIDFGSPTCRAGLTKLNLAIKEFGKPVTVKLHAFRIDPNAPADYGMTTIEALCANENITPERANQMLEKVHEMGREVGLNFNFDIARGGNTIDAFRITYLAQEHKKQLEVAEALFTAHFEQGILISDHQELKKLALAHGLPESEIDAVLSSNKYTSDVETDEKLVITLKMEQHPYFIFGSRINIVGVKSPDEYAAFLNLCN
jgi:predicted DsbA family dithiol-disulfide isomerase